MVGKAKPPTADEKRRLETMKDHMPCLPCLLVVNRTRLPEIHHVVSGFRREGHDQTVSLCLWHHRGHLAGDMSKQEMSGWLGPSLAMGKRTFQEFFGPERGLVEIQNLMIDGFAECPWFDYNVPTNIRREARELWTKTRP